MTRYERTSHYIGTPKAMHTVEGLSFPLKPQPATDTPFTGGKKANHYSNFGFVHEESGMLTAYDIGNGENAFLFAMPNIKIVEPYSMHGYLIVDQQNQISYVQNK